MFSRESPFGEIDPDLYRECVTATLIHQSSPLFINMNHQLKIIREFKKTNNLNEKKQAKETEQMTIEEKEIVQWTSENLKNSLFTFSERFVWILNIF